MFFKSHIPSFPLNHFVESLYYFEGYIPKHSIDRFLPDGNVNVVIDLTDIPKYIYDNETLEEKQTCTKAWVSGIRTEFICIPSGLDAKNMIINFKKGLSYPFFNPPLSEMINIVADAEQIFGPSILEMREMLQETEQVDDKFAIVEKYLLGAGRDKLEVNPVIKHTINRLTIEPNNSSLKKISDETGYSQKHFIQLFKDHVGVTPKVYARIMRFQKAIMDIERNGDISWTGLALDCGYYDQSHFINDFRLFSGFTPEEYMLRKNGQMNYVPVR